MSTFQELTLQYSGFYKNQLKRLAEPLFQTFGINYFFYLFISKNRTCHFLGTHIDLIQHYFDEKMHHCHPLMVHTDQVKDGLYLYDSVQHKDFQTSMDLLEKRYDTKHSALITQNNSEGCKIYGFSVPSSRKNYESLIINNAGLLRKFINHFEIEMEFVLNKMRSQPIDLSVEMDPFVDKKLVNLPEIELSNAVKCHFLKQIKQNSFEDLKFTKREHEVIQLFLTGQSAREIAIALHLSIRTIEHHFEIIKQKLNCRKKSEMFAILLKLSE